MTLQVKYETVAEAQMRLQGTVVLYDNEPVLVSNVTQEPDLPKGDIFRVYTHRIPVTGVGDGDRRYISSGKFDLTPFKMGFMNLNGEAYYLSRNSARQNRQGLGDRSLTVTCMPGHEGGTPRFNTIIGNQAFADMVHGRYPSIEEAVRSLRGEEVKSVAISREYALAKHETLDELLVLCHKQTVVGFMETSGRSFKIGKKFKFLKEELQEKGIPCSHA